MTPRKPRGKSLSFPSSGAVPSLPAQHAMQVQGELFRADTQWFHFFRSMVDSGDLARISGSTLKVYVSIKMHANYHTGLSFPSINTIAKDSGLSVPQVKRAIRELSDSGYIVKSKVGRSSTYRVREVVHIRDESGNHTGTASWEYVPSAVEEARGELKGILKGDAIENAKIVHIERMQININHVETGGLALNINGLDDMQTTLSMMPDGQLKTMLERAFQRLSTDVGTALTCLGIFGPAET